MGTHRRTFSQPSYQLGVASATRTVERRQAVLLRTDVERSASLHQELSDLEMPIQACAVERPDAVVCACLHACALDHEDLCRLEMASLAGTVQ